MKVLIEGAGYKYLGILQADQIRYAQMKEKVKTEFLIIIIIIIIIITILRSHNAISITLNHFFNYVNREDM